MAILVFTFNSFAQEKNTTHKVVKGETITQIAQKYNITPYDIYQLNPDAKNGLKVDTVLLIPKKGNATKVNSQVKTHKVEPKETLYGIANKYGITAEALIKNNPDIEKYGMQIGRTLVIPSNLDKKNTVSTSEKPVYHEVLPKETKYSIAKQYGITVEELEKRNPEIIPNLSVGYKLLVRGNAAKQVTQTASSAVNYVDYEVKPKETLYSLSKMSGLSQEELTKLNPALANGLEIGMILKVPSTALMAQETKKEYVVLSKKSSTDKKKLVLLLPFNISKIEGDTVNSTQMRLKKDKFLNMTLDFYSGALMAIDSAKTLGIPVDVSIFDSHENKTASNISNINLDGANAVVGPFYQTNVEKVAELLGATNVPVISPLSKDLGTAFPNLYQTIPSSETLRSVMFDYMRAKGGNIIAVVDKKKESVRQYIRENQKDVQFAPLLESGSLNVEGLKSLLVKDKINYVVLETANTVLIKWTLNTLMGALVNYKVQLVILESNDTLDTDEINFEDLLKLKLMYPSVTRENESPEALLFERAYRKKNKVYPSTFATRGFDVTFDTMMRLSQDKSYQETVDTIATEQVDNKFEYYKKEDGGYTNKGVYVLYYDADLKIKVAN